ncbi:MAG TPA: penicillin acylase family protein [Stellaceae bacterium]|jgi:penicillin amidase|nr:penicillin acylase family protein [Stellaceae bacterium]
MGRRILIVLLLSPIVVALSGLLWLHSSLPPLARSRVVQGITAPLRIARDAIGVPTIVATNDLDAAFALGYVHAEDRLFQMDAQRRYGAGRLAEWFGARVLDSDRMMRTLGLARAAERQLGDLPDEVQAAFRAYAAGVNAYITDRRWALPPEYYLLRAKPEPWRAVDTLIWGKLMAWQLAGNYRGELVRAKILEHVKPEEMPILYPGYPKEGPVILGAMAPIYRNLPLASLLALTPALEDPVRASNNWVVAGNRSSSGKPILANDPHLGLDVPGVWYLVHIATPAHKLEGGTMPGAPIVLVGHNERIAWGLTNTGSDVSDLFVEKLDPDDPSKYVAADGSRPFTTRTETIAVKDAPTVQLTVRETRHGPVISDLAGPAQQIAQPGFVLALQASYLMDGDRTPQALWEMNRAVDWESFQRALANFGAPEQNVIYADVDGHIGFMAPARVPTRVSGDGWLPSPGWSGEFDWTGWIPSDAMPRALDPPAGRIVTANNKLVPDNFPYFLGRDWDQPFRAQRIAALIDQRPQQSLDSIAAIQRDIYSPMADRLLPLMLTAPTTTPQAQAAIERLKGWDRRMDKDKVEPLIFTAWLRDFNRIVFANRLGTAFDDYWSLHPDAIAGILKDHQDWCDDRILTVPKTCPEQLSAALLLALDELTTAYGPDMDEWRWGRAHPAEFSHRLFAAVPILGRYLDTSIPADGGLDTINRGGFAVQSATQPYRDTLGPGLRMIVDMADPDRTRFMIVPGETGNPLSEHYADLVRPWRDGYMLMIDTRNPVATETLSPPP